MVENDKIVSKIKNLNYLIVDDDSFSRNILRTSLGQYFIRNVAEAKNAIDAIEILKSQPIDVVLLDQEMPGITGIELAKVIREGGEGITNTRVAIIIITGFADKDTVVEAKRIGVQDYLVKPISPQHMVTRIANIFSAKPKK